MGCFALPLQPAVWLPAVLAMAFLPAMLFSRRIQPGAAAVLAAGAGWIAAWVWRMQPGGLWETVDLGLIGPLVAWGAMSWRVPRRLQGSLLMGALVLAAAALVQFSAGQSNPLHWSGGGWPYDRVFGTLGNPNTCAAYLACSIPIALIMPWARIWKYTALSVLSLALLATASRGGWLAAIAGTGIIIRRRKPEALSVYLALIAAAVFIPWEPGRRLLAGLMIGDSTSAARLDIWGGAFEAWRASPLAGWGPGAPLPFHAHNFILEIAVRGGLFALAGMVPVFMIWGRALLHGRASPAVDGAVASISALFTFGLVDSFITHPALAGLFWLNMGICLREAVRFARNETAVIGSAGRSGGHEQGG